MLVRYEDLIIDPVGVVSQLTDSLGMQATREKIGAVVAASSFDALRRIEEREIAERGDGFLATPHWAQAHKKGQRFFNEGKVDGYRNVLTKQQITAAIERFMPIFERAGYESTNPTAGSATPVAAVSPH